MACCCDCYTCSVPGVRRSMGGGAWCISALEQVVLARVALAAGIRASWGAGREEEEEMERGGEGDSGAAA